MTDPDARWKDFRILPNRPWWLKHAFNVVFGGALLGALLWTDMPRLIPVIYAIFYGACVTVALLAWDCRREMTRLGMDLDD